jgi:arsenite oxidase small subunit
MSDKNNQLKNVKSKRRVLIKGVLALIGLSALGIAVFDIFAPREKKASTEKIKITNISNVPKGTAYAFNYPFSDINQTDSTGPCVLIRLPSEELRAFSSVCTHLGCIVNYSEENGLIQCPCHSGKYDPKSGDVLSGPPNRPLPRIELEVDSNGDVYATGVSIKTA